MLQGEHGGGDQHRRLPARDRVQEGRPQRHLGLAEPDVPADQSVHGPRPGDVRDDLSNRPLLILGLLEGEGRLQRLVLLPGRPDRLPGLGAPGRLQPDDLVGHLEELLLDLLLGLGPGEPPELGERRLRAVAAGRPDVALDQVHPGDGQVQPIPVPVVEQQVVGLGARHRKFPEPHELADAEVGVDHQVAGLERRHLGGVDGDAGSLDRSAEDLGVRQEGQPGARAGEGAVDLSRHDPNRGVHGRLPIGPAEVEVVALQPDRDLSALEHAEELPRAGGPGGDQEGAQVLPPPAREQLHQRRQRILGGRLGLDPAAQPGHLLADDLLGRPGLLGQADRELPVLLDLGLELFGGQQVPLGREDQVAGLGGLLVVGPGALPELAGGRLEGARVLEQQGDLGAQEVEGGLQLGVEGGQQGLDPEEPDPVPHRAEGLEPAIARQVQLVAEPGQRLGSARAVLLVEEDLPHRPEVDALDLLHGALARGIEHPDALDLVPQQLDPDRQREQAWVDVDDPATDGEGSRILHHGDLEVAGADQLGGELEAVELLALQYQDACAVDGLTGHGLAHQGRNRGHQQIRCRGVDQTEDHRQSVRHHQPVR